LAHQPQERRVITIQILGRLQDELRPLWDRVQHELGATPISMSCGELPYQQCVEMIQHADLFVMPSLNEGMSLAVIEAMHFGIPVIISVFCGIDQDRLIDDGSVMMPEVSANALADALQTLIARSGAHAGGTTSDQNPDLSWRRYGEVLVHALS